MRCLRRNKQKIYYALYSGFTNNVDANGNYTGDKTVSYSAPTALWICLSTGRDTESVEAYGVSGNHAYSLVTDDMACPIDEKSVLWVGIEPTTTIGEITTNNPPNYRVESVVRGLNSIAYTIRETNKS